MLRQLLASIIGQSWLKKAAISTPIIRDLAWRFVAGENLDAGVTALRKLNASGIKGTLNYIGTHVTDESVAVAAADSIIEALTRIHKEGLDSEVSIKLTHIGLDIDDTLCIVQLQRILDQARELHIFICIDMEESSYVEKTLRFFDQVLEIYGTEMVGIVLQSYLRHREGDLERMIAKGARIRLVKGGYWESADTVFRTKSDIDNAFLRDVQILIRKGYKPAVATHDPRFLAKTRHFAAKERIDASAYEFQFLYGVRPDLQNSLIRDGYTVRCYVPYGGCWYAYVIGCLRRIPKETLRKVNQWIRPQTF
jgi:proline dehydrogenase